MPAADGRGPAVSHSVFDIIYTLYSFGAGWSLGVFMALIAIRDKQLEALEDGWDLMHGVVAAILWPAFALWVILSPSMRKPGK